MSDTRLQQNPRIAMANSAIENYSITEKHNWVNTANARTKRVERTHLNAAPQGHIRAGL